MKDYRATIEKLRTDAADAALIRDLSTDHIKREIYDRLHMSEWLSSPDPRAPN